MNGWVKLYRKTLESMIFQNAELLKLFIWGLLKASHKEIWVPVRTGKGITEVHLKPGQFIFGRKTAAKELGQKPHAVYKRSLRLVDSGNWHIQSNTHYSIVTICNYELYQGIDNTTGTPKGTTKEHPRNTNKN